MSQKFVQTYNHILFDKYIQKLILENEQYVHIDYDFGKKENVDGVRRNFDYSVFGFQFETNLFQTYLFESIRLLCTGFVN